MAYHVEFLEARQTLDLSARTASLFVAQLGGLAPILIPPLPGATLGKRPGFQATVLDQKYWFAKLYELVTYEELGYSTHTQHPGFSLHFMKVFYGIYFGALQNYLKNVYTLVSPLWMTHFSGPAPSGGEPIEASSKQAIEFSVRTGAIAHIQGDMPLALVNAYTTWVADPKPPFGDLKEDFLNKSKKAFVQAQARFYLDVNDKTFSPFSPEVGQFGAAVMQKLLKIPPSLPQMFDWREAAWNKAAAAL